MYPMMRRRIHPGLIIASVVVGLIIVILVGAKIKSLVEAFRENRDNKSEQQVLQAQGVKLTYPKSWYQNKASELFRAMDSTWYDPSTWGTDEDRIMRIFGALKNNLDFIELESAFGVKDGYDMDAWLRGDLSTYYLDQINKMMTNRGITKRV